MITLRPTLLTSILLGAIVIAQPSVIEDPDAYAVYAALLKQFAQNKRMAVSVRLLQETRPPQAHCFERSRPEWQSAMEGLRQANNRGHLLKPNMDLGVPHSLITPEILNSTVQNGLRQGKPAGGYGLDPLFAVPRDYVAVSAVGFNPGKTVAIVHIEQECDKIRYSTGTIVCQQGELSVWEKVAGHWQWKDVGCSWIA